MKRVEATVSLQECLLPGIYSMTVACPEAAFLARPGQFVNFYLPGGSHLLPRPISICEILEGEGLRFVYRIAGEGTKQLSLLAKGEKVHLSTPLGNGFPFEEVSGKRVLLLGGGIGVPPMVETAKALKQKGAIPVSVMGYRDQTFLLSELSACGEVYVATEDGSAGVKGTVLDCLKEKQISGDLLFACGPKPMLRAVAAFAKENAIPCYVSMEERMACGVGACLACVCETTKEDPHFHTKSARVCKDGPVFSSEEVVL